MVYDDRNLVPDNDGVARTVLYSFGCDEVDEGRNVQRVGILHCKAGR